MKPTSIPYFPVYIRLHVAIVLPALIIIPLALGFDHQFFFEWGLTTFFSMLPLTLKLAAPRVPLKQAAACSVTIIILNYLSGIMLSGGSILIWFLISKLIELVCVLGFGLHWVRRHYIPSWANKW